MPDHHLLAVVAGQDAGDYDAPDVASSATAGNIIFFGLVAVLAAGLLYLAWKAHRYHRSLEEASVPTVEISPQAAASSEPTSSGTTGVASEGSDAVLERRDDER